MNKKFSISFHWLGREYGNPIERLSLAKVSITVDSYCVTELEDQLAKTIRRGPRVSAHALAQWFAANWWRLRWEPERTTLSWLMSHKVGAAGEGYCWPDLVFCSDGDAVTIHARQTKAEDGHLVRYLQNLDIDIPVSDFEKEVDVFLDSVINRLTGEVPAENGLANLWKEVLHERNDPVSSEWRKLEACLGYDPDESPEGFVDALISRKKIYGASAIEEMAAASQDKALSDIESLWNDARLAAVSMHVSDSAVLRTRIGSEVKHWPLSWQRATDAAKIARNAWSIEPGPVSSKALSEIVLMPEQAIDKTDNIPNIPVTAGFRDNRNLDAVKMIINKRSATERRFALARLMGDHLITDESERLLPASDAATHRQKFQRAFAQEFLCPYQDLMNFFGVSNLNEEAIEDAAAHFDVSPLLVRTTLVNKGHLDRTRLVVAPTV